MGDSDSTDIQRVVERVCAELRLGPFAAKTVEAWVRSDPATWPSCCLSDCDPCNDLLRHAARVALERLESHGG